MSTDLRTILRDGAYVTVGAGVIAIQRAQVARRDARSKAAQRRERLAQRLTTLRQQFTEAGAKSLEDARGRVDVAAKRFRTRIEPLADRVQERLPEPLANAVAAGRARVGGSETAEA